MEAGAGHAKFIELWVNGNIAENNDEDEHSSTLSPIIRPTGISVTEEYGTLPEADVALTLDPEDADWIVAAVWLRPWLHHS